MSSAWQNAREESTKVDEMLTFAIHTAVLEEWIITSILIHPSSGRTYHSKSGFYIRSCKWVLNYYIWFFLHRHMRITCACLEPTLHSLRWTLQLNCRQFCKKLGRIVKQNQEEKLRTAGHIDEPHGSLIFRDIDVLVY